MIEWISSIEPTVEEAGNSLFRVSVRIQLRCDASSRLCRWAAVLTSEVENERSNLERHLLSFAHNSLRFGLGHLQFVGPRIDLNACAERQGRCRGGTWLRFGLLWGGRRACNVPAGGDSVAQMWADKIGKLFRPLLERLEENLCCVG